jgi:hypothetical protein
VLVARADAISRTATGAPHWAQNFAPEVSDVPQAEHVTASGFPHASQKRALSRFSVPQFAQITPPLPPR